MADVSKSHTVKQWTVITYLVPDKLPIYSGDIAAEPHLTTNPRTYEASNQLDSCGYTVFLLVTIHIWRNCKDNVTTH